MSTPADDTIQKETEGLEGRKRLVAGIALIGLGLIALLPQLFQFDAMELLILPALGLIFLAWGLATRNFGLTIPGGILSGLGLGVLLTEGGLVNLSASGDTESAIFMLAFAGGWVLITALSPLTAGRVQWWPLIPGAILAVIGLAELGGAFGDTVLKILNLAWPLLLIAGGAYLMLRRR